jgi:hypothetical protein
VDTSFCVFTVCSLCVKTAFNLDSGKITLWWTWMSWGSCL